MHREPRSEVIREENRVIVNLDSQTSFEVDMIVFLLMEISKTPLTEEKAKKFIDCLRDNHFRTDMDIARFEDMVGSIYEVLEDFCVKVLRKGEVNG